MPDPATASIQANGKTYALPNRVVAAICLDGSSDEYLNEALARRLMPNLERICREGVRAVARAAMPTFTNVNNLSIVTGRPPATHGICGNYFFEAATGQEVMMNSPRFLRAETILAAAAKAGRRVAAVTAKEKLRDLFARGLIENRGIAFSAERAVDAVEATHGIAGVESIVGAKTPAIYSADASLYVLRAGVALARAGRADFLYLSTTDYIQHKAAPSDPEALAFYAAIDSILGELTALGVTLGITADHGMNGKQREDGSPNVIYLETLLEHEFGPGFRVILPITDPYVAHHGALGSFAVTHYAGKTPLAEVRAFLLRQHGITEVWLRSEAAEKLELPADRLGELVIASGRDVTLGRTPAHHDLSALHGPLRSHGGRYEEMVPFIFSSPLNDAYRRKLAGDPRNFDVFDYLLNGLKEETK